MFSLQGWCNVRAIVYPMYFRGERWIFMRFIGSDQRWRKLYHSLRPARMPGLLNDSIIEFRKVDPEEYFERMSLFEDTM